MNKFYLGLEYGGAWVIFESEPFDATPEKTGFFAVSIGYDKKETAEAQRALINTAAQKGKLC